MKVILESMAGTRFPVELGDSARTLKEVKEKIEKALFIPKVRQILYFNGNILSKDADILDIKNGSVIRFRVAGEYPARITAPAPAPAPAPKPVPEAEIMNLQLAISPSETIDVKACGGDTIRELKEEIESKEGTPADYILITTEDGTGMEIPDYRRLRDYAISLVSGLTVEFLSFEEEPRKSRLTMVSFSSNSSPPSSPPRKRSRLSVMSSASSSSSTPAVDADKISLGLQYQWKSIMPAPVEVRTSDMVRELRTRLEEMNFKVPGNREYCFFHKLLLLDEDRSFASQNVKNGDIVYICSPGLSRTGY